MAGKEHDLVGVVLIGVGAVLALAMYFDLGGPLGSALDTFVGWFFGLARYAVPIVLVVIGVAFIRKGRSSSPLRLVLGWGLVAAAALGLLHVIRNPDSFTDIDGLGEAGGWLGALLVEPIATLIAKPGAVVVMLALGVGGAALITQTSLRTMAMHTGRGVGAVAKPLGQYTKRALSDLSTLSSEREGGRQKTKRKRDNWGDPRPRRRRRRAAVTGVVRRRRGRRRAVRGVRRGRRDGRRRQTPPAQRQAGRRPGRAADRRQAAR